MKNTKKSAKAATRRSQEAILVSTSGETRAMGRPRPIAVDVLSENVNIFIGQLGTVLDNAPEDVKKFRLTELEVSVEVTAKGELSILGSGVGAEAKGGLKFVFKKT